MPVYEFRTQSPQGKPTLSRIAAESPRQARDLLRAQGISFDQIRLSSSESIHSAKAGKLDEAKSTQWLTWSTIAAWIQGNRAQSSVTWFIREFATLLRVGTPIMDAFDMVIPQSSRRFQGILLEVRERVKSGTSLADALRPYRFVFEPVLIEMIQVGERSGSLPSVLSQVAEFRERKSKLKNRVLSSLLYPSLLLCLSVAVSVFLMTVVVPTLLQSLQEMQKELPLPTLILKGMSDFLIQYGWIVLLGIIGILVVVGSILRTDIGALWKDRTMLRLPLIGGLIIKQNCSRLCLTVSTLLASGVELVRSLEIAESTLGNRILKQIVSAARHQITQGADISKAIGNNPYIPVGLIQVFHLGQNTGEMDILLREIASEYDSQVNAIADRIATLLEPILIIILSLIVGFILFATLLPILETGNALSET
jgi:type II secretory pathway component PulF